MKRPESLAVDDINRPIFVVLSKVNVQFSGPMRLYAPTSAAVARVRAKRGGGASPSDVIGQNGIQLKMPLAIVVSFLTLSASKPHSPLLS